MIGTLNIFCFAKGFSKNSIIKSVYSCSLTDNFSSGKDSGMPTFGRPENEFTDERIVHILSEASQIQQLKSHHTEDSHSNDDSQSPHNQCLSPFSKDSSQNRRLKKYENDDIPQEKVVRIYQEELAKLMGRRMDEMRNPREHFPG